MKKATVMSTLKKKIKEHQYKFTTQRKIVLQAFLDSKENHMSAEDVYEIVHEENPAIGLATVYRSLELFTSLELLKKLDFGDGRSRYELNDKTIDPVMAMQVRALAFIIEVQVMRPGYFHSLCYGKHNIPFSAQRAGSLTPFAANAAARSIQVPQVPQGFSPPS